MKPNPIFVAAAGFAMLGACSVTTRDENEAGENGAATATEGNVLPVTDNEAHGPADTLGNQLNQLNDESANAAGDSDANQQ